MSHDQTNCAHSVFSIMDACQPGLGLGGYDCEFVEEVPEHLTCIVCLGAFKEPHLLSCCGKKVCFLCITRIKNNRQACPHCRENDFNTMLDKDFNRQVLNLQVYCSKRIEGCEWRGDLRQLEKHLKEDCMSAEVPCQWKCGLKLTRKDIEKHEQDECPLRPTEVRLMRAIDKMEDRLGKLEAVNKGQVEEIKELKEKLRESEEEHAKERRELEEKIQKQNIEFTKSIRELNEERKNLYQKQLELIRQEVDKQVKQNFHNASRLAEKNRTEQITEEVRSLNLKVDETKDWIAAKMLESTESFATKQSLRRIQDILERMSRHGLKVPEWQQPVPVAALTDIAPCQFSMSNFKEHKGGMKTWYSPPFYNEPGGYKFCLRVDSHGMLEGKATHLSVWVYVMRGLHDEALRWPFTGKVTVQLLNWRVDRGHIQNIIAFDDQAGDKVRQRVTAGECAATGRGSSRFVSHDTLTNPGRNAEFVKDDCLCFRIFKIEVS